MRRYLYSRIVYVPSPERGECINIGLVAGNDEEGFKVWATQDLSRAACLDRSGTSQGIPEIIQTSYRDFEWTERRMNTVPTGMRNAMSYVQMTSPIPAEADSLDGLLHRLYGTLIA